MPQAFEVCFWSRLIRLMLAVGVLSVCMLASPADAHRHGWMTRGRVPWCGEGERFFQDYMKCDASVPYCFEYRNESCVGPDNWVCVHNINRMHDQPDNIDTADNDIKNDGFGNTRCCGGKYQSPIDIQTSQAHCVALPPPRYLNPYVTLTGHFENTGYYPEFLVPAEDYVTPLVLSDLPFTCAVPGSNSYVLTNVHIHSGIRSAHWSAHFVDGQDYDGEFHLVHVRSDFFKPGSLDMRCASQTPLGLAVIGVFLSLTRGEPNEELNKLLSLDNLQKIRESHAECDYDDMCDDSDDHRSSDEDDDCDDSSDDYGKLDGLTESKWVERSRGKTKKNTIGVKQTSVRRKRDGGKERREEHGRQRRVHCACRRREWEELLRYAKYGEEFQCRLKYKYGLDLLHDDTQHHPCNQHANGKPCGDEGVVKDFQLRPGLMLPPSGEFWQYFGSLTTPPCSEVVNWIIMKEPIRITREQLDHMHLLKSRRGDHLISEFGDVRPIQPLNGRTITTNSCY